MATVNRTELLTVLERVQAGVASNGFVQQSDCFIFDSGKVVTFNAEVACRSPSGMLDTIKGAVKASPLLNFLRQNKEEKMDVEVKDNCLWLKEAKGSGKAYFRMENEILLSLDKVEDAKDWTAVPSGLTEAIGMVEPAAGTNEKIFASVCVHLHPKWVEASDTIQIARYKMKTGLPTSVVVRRDAVKHVVKIPMTRMSVTDAWFHMKDKTGFVFSCRRYTDENGYPDLTPHLAKDGDKLTLPKQLTDTLTIAETFSKENSDDNLVRVELKQGRLWVSADGVSGGYSKPKKVDYTGKDIEFVVNPNLMKTVMEHSRECFVNQDILKVDGGRFVFVVSLEAPAKAKKEGE